MDQHDTIRPAPARPTIKDVAARAGVSIKTVSRVINDEPRVSPETTKIVMDAITALGFRRNDAARTLRQGSTVTLGLVLEDFSDPFSSTLTAAVEQQVHRHGYTLLAGTSAEDSDRERELITTFCARRVSGLIVVPTAGRHQYLLPDIAAGVAVVFVDRPTDLDVDTVLSDNIGGARTGVLHLVRQGHRRIGFLGDRPDIYTAAERLAGYRDALSSAGLAVDAALIEMAPPSVSGMRDALARMLAGPDPATAVFTGNGPLTVAALQVFREYAERPALVGFDDFALADLVSPGITVVAQDPAALGRTAADLLVRRLAGHAGPAQKVVLPTALIPRGSGELRR
ncbi:MAG: LacI family DNA-binding transcriptional regulator [Micromonosporaceae bacterium]